MDTNNRNESGRPNRGNDETRQAAPIMQGNCDKHQRWLKDPAVIGEPPRSGSPEPAAKSAVPTGKASSRATRLQSGPSLYERLLAEEISIRESFARR